MIWKVDQKKDGKQVNGSFGEQKVIWWWGKMGRKRGEGEVKRTKTWIWTNNPRLVATANVSYLKNKLAFCLWEAWFCGFQVLWHRQGLGVLGQAAKSSRSFLCSTDSGEQQPPYCDTDVLKTMLDSQPLKWSPLKQFVFKLPMDANLAYVLLSIRCLGLNLVNLIYWAGRSFLQ